MTDPRPKPDKYSIATLSDFLLNGPLAKVAAKKKEVLDEIVGKDGFHKTANQLSKKIKQKTKIIDAASRPKVEHAGLDQNQLDNLQIGAPQPASEFRQRAFKASNRLTKGGAAGNLWRADNAVAKLIAEIKKLGENEWVRVTADGQGILGAGTKLSSIADQIMKKMRTNLGNLADEIANARDDDELDLLEDLVDELEADFDTYNTLLNQVVQHVNKLVTDEAWKAAIPEKVSGGKKTAIAVVGALLQGIVTAAKAAAPPGWGIAVGGAAIQLGISEGTNRTQRALRDKTIKKIKAKEGEDWAFEKLDEDLTKMAQRVAGKQKENLGTVLNVVAIAGAEVPGWGLIRTAIETALVTYYDARVRKLKNYINRRPPYLGDRTKLEAFKQAIADWKNDLTEFFKEDMKEKILEICREKIGEKAGELIKEVGKASKEKTESFAAALGETAGDILKTGAENIAIQIFGKLIKPAIAALPIDMAQPVSGSDLREIMYTIDLVGTDTVFLAQTDKGAYKDES